MLFLFVFPVFVFSQRVEIPAEYVRNNIGIGMDTNIKYEGSPYLNEKFEMGSIFIKNLDPINASLRYNAFSETIEMIDDEMKITALYKNFNVDVKIGNRLFKLFKNVVEGKNKIMYYEPLNDSGELILLRKDKKIFVESKKAKSAYTKDKPAKFQLKRNYFIHDNNKSKIVELKLKKKNILSLLTNHKDKINDYIKSNKLKLKNEKDVIKLFNYYNLL